MSALPDMAPLVERLRLALDTMTAPVHEETVDAESLADFVRGGGLRPRGEGQPEILVGDAVAVELGHPTTASQSLVLTTWRGDAVQAGRLRVVGPELSASVPGERRPFAQVVVLALREGETPDPFALETAQFLTHRVPGYMVRSVPGRLWARVGRDAVAAGMSLGRLGRALLAAFAGDFPAVAAVEVVLVASSEADVAALAPIAAEARLLSGRHRKLVLAADGLAECSELDCEVCEEKPVCDNLRGIVIKHRALRAQEAGR